MLKTMQSGGQLRNTAMTEESTSASSQSESSELTTLLQSLRGSKVSKPQLREKIFEALYDNATEQPEVGKWYFFEYDPKYRDSIKKWDEYPLIKLMEIKNDRLLGMNIHFLRPKARLGSLNKEEAPMETLRYYIPKNADNLFFEIPEEDMQAMSQLPLEQFHTNR